MTTERETGSAQTAMINAVIETAVPALVAARDVLDRFHAMMRSKDEGRLDPWIVTAASSKLAAFRWRRSGQGRRGSRYLEPMVERTSRRHR
jgi:hypothetical protein